MCAGTLSSRFALRAPRASAVALEQWVVGALVARVQCAQVEIEGDLVVGATLLARDPLGKRVFRVHVVCMSSASPSALDRSVAKDGSWYGRARAGPRVWLTVGVQDSAQHCSAAGAPQGLRACECCAFVIAVHAPVQPPDAAVCGPGATR